MWSESYDRELRDIFLVQADISKKIADSLEVTILTEEMKMIDREPTKNTEAYELCLKGIYYYMNEEYETGLRKAREHLERAVQLDPSYALAHAWLSMTYMAFGSWEWISPEEMFPLAEKEVFRALELDPNLAEAHVSLSAIMETRLDWNGSEAEIRNALELKPSAPSGHECLAGLLILKGKLDEAELEARKALELDPIAPRANHTMALVLYNQKKIRRFNRISEKGPRIQPVVC